VSKPCVAFIDGVAAAYATVDTTVGEIVITQPMRITFQEHSLKIDFGMSDAGVVTLPGVSTEILRVLGDRLADRQVAEFHKDALVVAVPVLKLEDGRSIELIDVRCRPGTLEITCRTVASAKRIDR
jgi:hypothetical protein